MTEKRKIYLL